MSEANEHPAALAPPQEPALQRYRLDLRVVDGHAEAPRLEPDETGPIVLFTDADARLRLLQEEHAAGAVPVPLFTDAVIGALSVVTDEWSTCKACGGENDDAHDQQPHCFEGRTDTEMVALLLEELRGVGLTITPEAQLQAAEAADARLRLLQENDAVIVDTLVMMQLAAHWFCQGGAAQFGDLGRPLSSADDFVATVLRLVREKLEAAEAARDAALRENEELKRQQACEWRLRAQDAANHLDEQAILRAERDAALHQITALRELG